MHLKGPIGVFDSGYGGLTVLKEIAKQLPAYDYLYMGDNARAPYGTRSFDTVYNYTLQSVQWFFSQGCPLVILACNTASAKALRTIQQNDLRQVAPDRKVLGVIRPTTERIGSYTKTRKVGVLGTPGTVQSQSYLIEINKFFPDVEVYQESCPMWVPLIENNEHNSAGADYFIKKNIESLLSKSPDIDVILLACTHYPLLRRKLEELIPGNISLLAQGEIVAESLADYLQRHKEIEQRCTKNGTSQFFTTDSAEEKPIQRSIFYGKPVQSVHVDF